MLYGVPQKVVLVAHKFYRGVPFRCIRRGGNRKPVAPLECKRTSVRSCQLAPDGVLPVSGVEHNLPDTMPSGCGMPCGFLCAYTPYRAPEVCPVPCPSVKGLVKAGQEQLDLALEAVC